jgi:hypothetical protein
MTDEPLDLDATSEAEVVDGLPVLAEVRPVEVVQNSSLGAVQAAAAAATGFVAGVATLAVIQHLASRRMGRVPPGAGRRSWDYLPVTSSRTYIVDVHTLGAPGE